MLGCDGLATFAGASRPATATWLKKEMDAAPEIQSLFLWHIYCLLSDFET